MRKGDATRPELSRETEGKEDKGTSCSERELSRKKRRKRKGCGGQAVSGQGKGKVQRERTQRSRHRDQQASTEDEEGTLSTKPGREQGAGVAGPAFQGTSAERVTLTRSPSQS